MENHNDPYGYNEGVPLTPDKWQLAHSGDIIATVMGEEIIFHNKIPKKDNALLQVGCLTPLRGEQQHSITD